MERGHRKTLPLEHIKEQGQGSGQRSAMVLKSKQVQLRRHERPSETDTVTL